jgi:hypothetical protein
MQLQAMRPTSQMMINTFESAQRDGNQVTIHDIAALTSGEAR